jgi:hypothetical protein
MPPDSRNHPGRSFLACPGGRSPRRASGHLTRAKLPPALLDLCRCCSAILRPTQVVSAMWEDPLHAPGPAFPGGGLRERRASRSRGAAFETAGAGAARHRGGRSPGSALRGPDRLKPHGRHVGERKAISTSQQFPEELPDHPNRPRCDRAPRTDSGNVSTGGERAKMPLPVDLSRPERGRLERHQGWPVCTAQVQRGGPQEHAHPIGRTGLVLGGCQSRSRARRS